MKTNLLDQIRKRREALGLKIVDMPLRVGLTRQQYGKIEAAGNPRLTSLDQIAEGLDATLVLVPKSKLDEVLKLLAGQAAVYADASGNSATAGGGGEVRESGTDYENPWGDI